LRDRGISNFTIDDLSIGYCTWDTYGEVGINLYGRVTFPIKDQYGDVIGFGGRIIGDGSPKYLNSPSGVLYDKSRALYNIDNACDYILDSGYAIVVEGYMDVASLWEAGIKNVVATCGTSLTKYHIRLLKRFADEIYLMYDDDEPGRASAVRGVLLSFVEKFPVYACNTALGMDPDEYVKMIGKEGIIDLINEAKKEHQGPTSRASRGRNIQDEKPGGRT
jgi:DNA primase